MIKIPKQWKRTRWYRELWYFYYHNIKYKRFYEYPGYFYNRFWVRGKIRKLTQPISRPAVDTSYSTHLLCSHNDIDLLLWALASWYKVVPTPGLLYIHEDGSFTEKDKALIAHLLPDATFVDFKWATRMAEEVWLVDMPNARKLRREYHRNILITKLIDQRFVSSATKRFIVDTDILWFKEPTELLERLRHGPLPFFQYGGMGAPVSLFKDGTEPAAELRELNGGIIGFGLEHYTLEDLEAFCGQIDMEVSTYFIEHAGWLWILSRQGQVTELDREAYQIYRPLSPAMAAKHYTGPRREDFWREGIAALAKRILRHNA